MSQPAITRISENYLWECVKVIQPPYCGELEINPDYSGVNECQLYPEHMWRADGRVTVVYCHECLLPPVLVQWRVEELMQMAEEALI